MRLFGKVNSAIDRYDRAEWLTCPFDLAFAAPSAIAGIDIIAALTDAAPSALRLTDASPLSVKMTDNVTAAVRIRE